MLSCQAMCVEVLVAFVDPTLKWALCINTAAAAGTVEMATNASAVIQIAIQWIGGKVLAAQSAPIAFEARHAGSEHQHGVFVIHEIVQALSVLVGHIDLADFHRFEQSIVQICIGLRQH